MISTQIVNKLKNNDFNPKCVYMSWIETVVTRTNSGRLWFHIHKKHLQLAKFQAMICGKMQLEELRQKILRKSFESPGKNPDTSQLLFPNFW